MLDQSTGVKNVPESGTNYFLFFTSSASTRRVRRNRMELDNTTSASSLSTEFDGMVWNKKSRACIFSDHSL